MIDKKYKTNARKTREAISPTVDIVKLFGYQNIFCGAISVSWKNQPDLGQCGLLNTKNFKEY